jgi:peptidoglycan/LPS O-acetylase OafA/YrhL
MQWRMRSAIALDSPESTTLIVTRPPFLGALAHGRANNFQLLRFLAASMVVFFHCFALTDHWTEEPLWRMTRDWNFGALGVQIFFVISGFLVTQSWQQRGRLVPFLAARILRIYPGLILATAFTLVLAGISSPLAWPAFLGEPQTLDFAWHTALGWELRDTLTGAFVANPFPSSVNGSLWSLPLELRLYLGVALAGVVGLLSRRWLFAAAVAAAIVATLLWPHWLPLLPDQEAIRRVILLFVVGALACVVRDWLPVSLVLALAAVVVLLVNPAGIGRGVLFAPLFTYSVLTLAYHPLIQWAAFNRIGDYSYGIYVYAFPIQQTLIERSPGWLPWTLFATAMPLVLLVAMVSWHGVEKPVLALKARFR